MHKHPFGSTGPEIPVIGQGSWYIEQGQRSAVIAALRLGLDRGMTHIDTAEMYGAGAAEELVGEAIAGRRDEVFLVSKVLPHNASLKGTILACERSLRRLKTDHLDCYLLHWQGSHPLTETFEAFERLRDAGKILSWGLSNFDSPDLEEAFDIAGEDKIACNQVLYHLEERAIEHTVIPWCKAHGVAVVAYSPFGHSEFVDADSAGGKVLQQIAKAHDVGARQIALAFLTRDPSLFTIPKSSKPAHTEQNATAGTLELSEAELARIDAAFPRGPRRRSLPML